MSSLTGSDKYGLPWRGAGVRLRVQFDAGNCSWEIGMEALEYQNAVLVTELKRAHARIATLENGLKIISERSVRPGTAGYEIQQIAIKVLDLNPTTKRGL